MTAAEAKKPTFGSFLGGEWTQEQLDELVARFAQKQSKTPAEAVPSVKAILQNLLAEQGPLYKRKGMSENQMEGMYNIGYQAYHQGNYRHAIGAFRLLVMLNPLDTRYLFSLGLCLEKSKQFYEAATAYLMNSFLEEGSPIPSFRAAICFLELGQNAAAKLLFHKAIEIGHEAGEKYALLIERAQLFLTGLESKRA